MMHTALSMYDWPHLRQETDAFWRRWAQALRKRGINAPDSLDRERSPEEILDDPDLLVTQTCGLPYVSGLRDRMQLVATPCYRATGCMGADYRSVLVTRKDAEGGSLAAFAGRVVAINGWQSHSGHTALWAAVHETGGTFPFFRRAHLSGSHAGSMEAVAGGTADLASIDCVTWAHIAAAGHPAVPALRSIGMTPPASGLPFVTPRRRPPEFVAALRESLEETFADPVLAEARKMLRLDGVRFLGDQDYEPVAELHEQAQSAPIAESIGTGP